MKKIEKTISYAIGKTYVVSSIYVITALFLLLYGYLVTSTIFDTASSKKLSYETARISSKLYDLETKYIQMENVLTLKKAESLGFYEVNDPTFVSKKSVGQVLTLQSNI